MGGNTFITESPGTGDSEGDNLLVLFFFKPCLGCKYKTSSNMPIKVAENNLRKYFGPNSTREAYKIVW